MKRILPYWYHLLALTGCVIEAINILTGHLLSGGGQLFWLCILVVWIVCSALATHTQKMTESSRNTWKSMYEQVSGRRWN